jgi:NADPH-dependent 2,4-dienoyl-CoA reductase/sulfur reductase-like enzyme
MSAIRERALAAGPAGPGGVMGGGLIGVGVAASLAALGLSPTIVELADGLWGGTLGEEISGWGRASLKAVGVSVRLQSSATRIERGDVWVGDRPLSSSIVVAGVGVEPRADLAATAGIEVRDGIVVDGQRATSARDVFAAGDVARAPLPLADGAAVRVEHWHSARESGEAAAAGMLGETVPRPPAPWVYSEFADQLLDVVGWAPDFDGVRVLGDPDARGADGKARFAVAYLRGDAVTQVAIVNGAVPVEEARAIVATRPHPASLSSLSTSLQ